MKKIFYILDGNGEFLSEDGKKRYRALTGQALYQYLRTEEGKIKYFDVWQDDDRAVMVGVEVPPERVKIYAAEQRRRRYINVFNLIDYQTMLENLVHPYDIIYYLQERSRWCERTNGLPNFVFGESHTSTIIAKIANETDFARFFVQYLIQNLIVKSNIDEKTKQYIALKCENDANYVVRKVYKEINAKKR